MYEKYTQNPEASGQAIADVYKAAATYLDARLEEETADIDFHDTLGPSQRRITVWLPELNGRQVELYYDRPCLPNDPTQLADDIPLHYEDDNGNNIWQTPITANIYNNSGDHIHEYCLEYIGDDETARAIDSTLQPGQDIDDYAPMTYLDANELAAHISWALSGDIVND